MRKPLAFFVAGFATVAGGGFAVAMEGSPASSTRDVPEGPPFADMEWVGDLPPGPPADNHGAVVSEAAQSCPTGPGHGQCVSEVARENRGQADDEVEVDEPEVEEPEVDDDEELPGTGTGHQSSNGRGNGQGNGRGHERDGE